MKVTLAGLFLGLATVAAIGQQQPPDPAFLQKAIATLQQQRNAALDAQVISEARAAMLAEEIAALKKQIEDAKKPAEKN